MVSETLKKLEKERSREIWRRERAMEMVFVIPLFGLLSVGRAECRATININSDLKYRGFKKAIADLSKFSSDGGAQLIVPPRKWLTGSFNLTSHFTLYLQKDVVILASQDENDFPLIPVLPSYGRGRDAPGDSLRYSSFIHGNNLTDVILAGANGTIDGQEHLNPIDVKIGEL
ncbi:hypothetical protein IFM89_029941 [Coptis chinensis]|uniref:Polygalacturonase n=1 Tax=Coptis chinensis TaxID=261450 RepID=A0A835LT93_9MAGN|nr:hypothetical protein IFM89_029941 [Coptis chinensis]